MEEDFFRFDSFKETKYRFCDRKISDTFKIHILHSSAFQTRHVFDFLQVFAKSGGIGQKFKDYFFCYLWENDIKVFNTEKKYNKGKARNTIYLLNKTEKSKFLDSEIKDPGWYGLCHYISL